MLFAFSVTICNAIKHYLDGLFFFTLCVLLSVMMVYKYWDSITVRYFLLLSDSLYLFLLLFYISIARRSGILSRFQSRRMGSKRSFTSSFRRIPGRRLDFRSISLFREQFILQHSYPSNPKSTAIRWWWRWTIFVL